MREVRSSRIAFAAAYVVLVVGLFLALGGAAYAQTPASDQYDSKVEDVSTSTRTGDDPQQVQAAQSLPNTGLSLLVVAVVGGGLVAAGVVLRRRERRDDG